MNIQSSATAPPDWDAYTRSREDGSAYHLAAAVGIGASTFGLEPTFITAREPTGRLVGVLPVIEQSSLIFGRFLTSVPFFTYGGLLADSAEVAQALAERAAELARQRRAQHVELRQIAPVSELSWPQRLDKVSMFLALPQTEEALGKQLGSKLRSQIRRADKENPEVLWGGAELVPQFYAVFARTMHELGTPVYPRRFFEVACTAFGELARVLVIRVGGAVQASAIVVRHGSRVEVPWAAATPEAKRNAINMRMYWEMLKFSVAQQAAAFDFGRSTVDSGTYRFKAQWGAQPVQLHWHYWLPAGVAIPRLNQGNPKYALAARAWRKLPLWAANTFGPQIVRNLP
jgi:FemAB-related protein (PEP-CTERM system-associated)